MKTKHQIKNQSQDNERALKELTETCLEPIYFNGYHGQFS